jgi:hypothetical protein
MRFTPPWCGQDVFFLTDALQRGGMSYAEVAGFLGRDVGEVRDKAKRLGVKRGHFALRGAEAKPQYGFKRAPRAHDGGVRTGERSPA